MEAAKAAIADAHNDGLYGVRAYARAFNVTLPPAPDYLLQHQVVSRDDCFVFDERSGGDLAVFKKTRKTYRKRCAQQLNRALMKLGYMDEAHANLKRNDRERKAASRAAARSMQPRKVVWHTMTPSATPVVSRP